MARQRWEYLTLDEASSEEVRNLGIDGWELVSVVYDPRVVVGFGQGGKVMYFKRPLTEDERPHIRDDRR